MVPSPKGQENSPRPKPWWREPEVLGLILLVIGVYFLRASDAPLRGEETRWALVAQEMVHSGDWIVPRQQDEPFLNRPPLHCWLIAATGLMRGHWDTLTFRLPSLFATLLSSLVVYGYGRVFLTRLGAFAAAAALVTMAELLQTCRLAETDALFIPLVAASLLVWHWGYLRNWPAPWMWISGYSFMALAALTKGPQAPLYFAGSIGAYLLVMGEWRRLFSVAHLLGILMSAFIIGAWFVPLAIHQGWAEACFIWTGQTALRMQSWTFAEVGQHMAQFPLEVLGCTMPWSLLLVAYLSRSFRAALGNARPAVVFLGVCLAVSFPTCWIPPGARSRYLAPMYPCLALLVGLVIQRCAAGALPARLQIAWKWGVDLLTSVMMLGALILAGVSLVGLGPTQSPWAEPPLLASLYAGAALVLACLTFRTRRGGDEARLRWGVIAVACFMGLVVSNVVTDFHVRTSPDTAADVAHVQEQLPGGVPLVSFEQIHHRFAFYYGKSIGQTAWPKSERDLDENLTYFCFDAPPAVREAIPFAWEEVAVISMDRKRRADPKEVVVIGRRVREPEAQARDSDGPRLRVGLTSR